MNKIKVNKEELDHFLFLCKAQPVGSGYIDVIVRRDFVLQLLEYLILNGIIINRITWWNFVNSREKRSSYGLGGPKSHYFEGWFSELCFGDDEISTTAVEDIMAIIENKEITVQDGITLCYRNDNCLTPALWLEVPIEWER